MDHMTFRAPRLAKEKRLAFFRIAPKGRGIPFALEGSQMAQQFLELHVSERAESRHSFCRFAVLHDLESFGVGQPLNFEPVNNVGPALAATPIQSVATSAYRFKSLAALGGSLRLLFPGLPRVLGCQTHGPDEERSDGQDAQGSGTRSRRGGAKA